MWTSPPRVAFTAVRCVNHGQLFRNRIMEGLSTTLERADLARLGVVPGERVLMSRNGTRSGTYKAKVIFDSSLDFV